MKKLLVISIISLVAACGGKSKQSTTTPANKTGASDGSGAMGGQSYGNGSAAAPKPSSSGDPCAM